LKDDDALARVRNMMSSEKAKYEIMKNQEDNIAAKYNELIGKR
jgi:hypothetical protein